MKILIVDDSPIFRQVLKEILHAKLPFVDIVEAVNGKEAFQEFETQRPQLVFMDIRLPHLNGLAVTRQIKMTDPGVTVIILTNHDTPEYRETAQEYGADAFLSKASAIEDEIEAALTSLNPASVKS